ncbi:MAG TPA: SRPBCC family protein [Steroidobacteraceae bacterium]|nr:SRPBCC family protein [Steroidobacteraceae bacterium]
MSEKRNSPADTRDRELVTSRTLNAPRELVFSALTDAKSIGSWWGPDGFTSTVHEMDVREGGVWRYTMHGPTGENYPNKVVYLEVVRPERLVYWHGSDGDVANDPNSFHVTITLAEVDALKTAITLHSVFATAEQFEVHKTYGAVEGANQNLARLEQYLKRQQR